MGNSSERRQERRERQRLWREWLTSFGDGSEKKAKIFFLVAAALALFIWGLGLIGVIVNIYVGGLVLTVAFVLGICALWIWEGFSRFTMMLRCSTLVVAGIVYFGMIGRQMI